jgi:hypothetical protein
MKMEKIVNTILGIITLLALALVIFVVYFGSNKPNFVKHAEEDKLFRLKPVSEKKFVNNNETKFENINNDMNEKLTVKTFSGALEGKKLLVFGTEIYAFIGIPYAEPPIGQLRFSIPKPGIVCFGTPHC